ncbi:hypothetical protein HDU76_012565 [Blyttiomyces sp. JEL0837]|nr:hypothetical protein HDU76_012565 [Blyttiomyces sp. JEL0837]
MKGILFGDGFIVQFCNGVRNLITHTTSIKAWEWHWDIGLELGGKSNVARIPMDEDSVEPILNKINNKPNQFGQDSFEKLEVDSQQQGKFGGISFGIRMSELVYYASDGCCGRKWEFEVGGVFIIKILGKNPTRKALDCLLDAKDTDVEIGLL